MHRQGDLQELGCDNKYNSLNVKLNSRVVNEFQTANDVTQNAQINTGVRLGKLHFICVTPVSGGSTALKTCNFWERLSFKKAFFNSASARHSLTKRSRQTCNLLSRIEFQLKLGIRPNLLL